MRRSTAALLVVAAVPALLVAPTLGPTGAQAHPVAPRLSTLALTGVDAGAWAAERTAPGPADNDVPTWAASRTPEVFTAPTDTRPFSLVGVTWNADQPSAVSPDSLTVTVRTHSEGVWQPWALLPTDSGDGPGGTPGEGAGEGAGPLRLGTSPYFAGPSDGVQVRVDATGALPVGLRVDLVDPGRSDADSRLVAAVPGTAAAATGMPAVITRAQWGADESLRNGSATYEPRVRVAFVHHTATSNSYTKDQAAAAVRSIYAYDTNSLGWSDIAYNVLVDKYGQVFEGRAGGLDRAVRSAATGGFNGQSWSVSALGNYQDSAPSSALLTSISKILAWKLGLEHRDPEATSKLVASGGSGTTSKYPDGTTVTFPVISGHRDAGSTACPGALLYAKLPSIRTQVASLMGASLYSASASPLLVPKGETTPIRMRARALTAQDWRVEVRKQGSSTVLRTYEGKVAADGQIDVSWNLEDADGDLVKAGIYTLTMQSWSPSSVAVPFAVNVGLFADPDVYDRPADGTFRLEGRGYGHGHGMSQFGAEGAARKGLTRDQILDFYYPGTRTEQASPTSAIRVSLSSAVRTTGAGKDVRLRAAPGLQVSEGTRTQVLPATLAGKVVTVWRTYLVDGQVSLYGWTGDAYHAVSGWSDRLGPFRFTTAPTAPTTSRVTLVRTTGHDTVYRGTVEVRRASSSTSLTAVSDVLLDDYVKSVVSAELPGGWTDTAYQAQAVAARSYAIFKRKAARAAGYATDICDTTSCQVYNGYSGETSPESKAGTATAGLYRTYAGEPIFAEYSSADGGYTADGGKPYLVARPDPYDGVVTGTANWGHAWTKDVAASTIEAAYPSIGKVERVVVVDRDGRGDWGGRVTSVRLEGSKDAVTVSGTSLRSALGLKSEWFRAEQVAPEQPRVSVPTSPPASVSAPGPVTGLAATRADRSVRLVWTAPAKAGASPISGYRVTVTPGGQVLDLGATARSTTVSGLVNGRDYRFAVVARNDQGSSSATSATATPTSGYGYPVTVPTRTAWSGAVPSATDQRVAVLGGGEVPATGVASVTLRVVASGSHASVVSVMPTGTTASAAQLTVPAGGTATNLVVTPVGKDGTVTLRSTRAVTIDVAVVAYDTRAGATGRRLVAVSPVKLGRGLSSSMVPLTVPVAGAGGIPADAEAALLQLTVSSAASKTSVQVSPDGASWVPAVTLGAGQVRTVPVIVPLGPDGSVRVQALGTGALVSVDAFGYYLADDGVTAAGRTRTVAPARIYDSRSGASSVPAAGSTFTVPVLGRGGVPASGVSAVVLDVIAYAPSEVGSLRVYPAGDPVPAVRAVSYDPTGTVRTTVIAKVGDGGAVRIYAPSGGAHVVVDVWGYVTG